MQLLRKFPINNCLKVDLWQVSWLTLSAYACSFALSIAMTQVFLISFLILVLFCLKREAGSEKLFLYIIGQLESYGMIWKFYSPLVLWIMISVSSSFLGLSVGHSLLSLFKFSLYLLLPLFVFLSLMREGEVERKLKVRKLIVLFIFSHGLAGLHTFVSTNLGYELKPRVPGPLTESGQLELLFPILLLLPSLFGRDHDTRKYLSISLLLMGLWVSITWLLSFKLAFSIGIIIVSYLFWKRPFQLHKKEIFILISVSLSLAALLLGLKRGPWFAIGVEMLIIGIAYFGFRSLSAFLVFVPFLFFSAVRDRLSSLQEHFFISGGRFDMWKLGLELIERFPLGLGFGNSDLIRTFDSTLPYMHRHMHNNFLNILLECGILGGVLFFIWILRIVRMSWPVGDYVGAKSVNFWVGLRGALVVSIIGWQLGGLVEYNLGDGEIRLFALVLLGIYLTSIYSVESEKI